MEAHGGSNSRAAVLWTSAIFDGRAEITGEGRGQRIHYMDSGKSYKYSDPEEKVRAELFAEA